MPAGHWVTIDTLRLPSDGKPWLRARCACGWRGPAVRKDATVQRHRNEHLAFADANTARLLNRVEQQLNAATHPPKGS